MSHDGAIAEGIITADGTVRFERLLPGPIERVWAYLTESDKRGTWLASGPMDLHVGGAMELHFRHADLSPVAEPVPEAYKKYDCTGFKARITRCDPPFLLSHTWPDPASDHAEVTYELTSQGDKVLLTLTHRRLSREAMREVGGGWHTHLDILVDRLTDRAPPAFWRSFLAHRQRYDARLDALPE
jgi:uncharacterized protein YndB with AHSA1/START domain